MVLDLSHIPNRAEKSRSAGITIVQDAGYSIAALENLLQTSSDVIDYVRIEPSAILSKEDLATKIAMYHENEITPFLSSVLFEAAFIRKSFEDYLGFNRKLKIDCLEISDGIIEIKPDRKGKLISELKDEFQVLSKVGPKKSDFVFHSDSWREYIETELAAGSTKVIIEGNQAGVSLSINGEQEVKEVLANAIAQLATIDQLVWEAPHVKQQVWYINNFGPNVNLAQISAQEALKLEALRLGLDAKTFTSYLPPHLTVGNIREVDQVYNFDWQI